jgi:hypothetical protein
MRKSQYSVWFVCESQVRENFLFLEKISYMGFKLDKSGLSEEISWNP